MAGPHLQVAAARQPETIDDRFAALSERVPGFAGLFFEDGDLIVVTTRPESQDTLVEEIRNFDGGALFTLPTGVARTPRIVVRRVTFDFLTLREWRAAVLPALRAGISLLDIDEVRNGVRIGVIDEASRDGALAVLDPLGLPRAGFSVKIVPRATGETTLQDRFRPLRAGIRIEDNRPVSGGYCTLGVNVNTQGGDGFLTSSHCTYVFAGTDAMYFHQPVRWDLVGAETYDPAPIPPGQGCWNPLLPCRYSDAAYVTYDFGAEGLHGTVARTTNSNGSITVSSTNPNFLIGSAPYGLVPVGTQVNKIGQTTGWTVGTVTNTCVDLDSAFVSGVGYYMLLCQGEANYTSAGGDSGSPVFTWDGASSYIALRGLHAAAAGANKYFSYWMHVDLEMNDVLGWLDGRCAPFLGQR